MVGGGRPLLPEILGHLAPVGAIDLEPIFACSASAITPSEKVQLILIGSLLRAFQ